MTKPKAKNRNESSGAVIKYVLFGVLVIACVVVFLLFGKKQTIAPAAEEPIQTAAPLPSGIPYEEFIETLKADGIGCGIGEREISGENLLRYPLTSEDGGEIGAVVLLTDSFGRISEAKLSLFYIQPADPDYVVDPAVRETIEAEARRRTDFQEKVINAYLNTLYGVFGSDFRIGSIDKSKLSPAVLSAYESGKTYEKKAGKARFFCETTGSGINNEFALTVQFTLSN